MKTTIEIAKTELKNLFYSPIAWLILIVFLVQCSFGFMDRLQSEQQIFTSGAILSGITERIFSGFYGFFAEVQSKLYLYLPLLTMGVFSREISSGSIKLLLSSPLRITGIVAGKYIGILSYCLLFMAILLLFCTVASFSINHLDWKLLISGLLGVYLMIAAYAAIGLFLSSCTGYQPVAAISTFAVLATLNFIGTVWQGNNFLGSITSFLSIKGRVEEMAKGLITTEQLMYFLAMIFLFTGLTTIKLQTERLSDPLYKRVLKYTGLIAGVCMTGYITSKPRYTLYFDMTRTREHTITRSSQELLKKMAPIHVHTYVNLLDSYAYLAMPSNRRETMRFFDGYSRYIKGGLLIDYTYYFDSIKSTPDYTPAFINHKSDISLKDIAINFADRAGFDAGKILSPDSIRRIIDLSPRNNLLTWQLESEGRTAYLGSYIYSPVLPEEKEVMDAIRVLKEGPVQVAFLIGHGERVAVDGSVRERDFNNRLSTLLERRSLVNHGFNFRKIRLDSTGVPANIDILMINDPREVLSPLERQRVNDYIAKGGNAIIMGEPDHPDIVSPLIQELGVHQIPGTLLTHYAFNKYAPDFLVTEVSPLVTGYSKGMQTIFADSGKMTTSNAGALAIDTAGSSFKITPLLITSDSNTWNHPGNYDHDAAEISFQPASGDQKGVFITAVTLERKIRNKHQRIIVMGDADMLSDGEINGYPNKQTWAFTNEIFKWLTNGKFPTDITYPQKPDTEVLITTAGISRLKMVLLFPLPGLLLLAGIIVLVKRKRK